MKNAQHTPEPWRIDDAYVAGKDLAAIRPENGPELIAVAWPGAHEYDNRPDEVMSDEEQDANASHIVACVNACAGIDPDAVPMMVSTLTEIANHAYDDDTPLSDILADFDAMRGLAYDALTKARGDVS